MTAVPALLAEIEDPLSASGWRVSRPDDEGALHAEVLRDLCDRGLAVHIGGAGTRGIAATLQLVDVLQEQVIFACHDDGIAVARALQARPLWAAARLHGLRVQFALAAPSAAREGTGHSRGERFLIQTRWPREIYRTSRRCEARLATAKPHAGHRAPVLRLMNSGFGHPLVSTRNLQVLDLSEHGCSVTLPAGMVPPAVGTVLEGVELDLGEADTVIADACVLHVSAAGRAAHRIGFRWQGLTGASPLLLRRWLAEASRPLPVGEVTEFEPTV